MSVLTIGGTGFLGKAIARELADGGRSVVCADLDTSWQPADASISVVEADVTNEDQLRELVADHSPEAIVNLAALIGTSTTHANPRLALDVNCVGTDNVFRIAAETDVDRVVWPSTCGIYGPASHYDETPIDESTIPPAAASLPDYLGFYAATKQLAEYQAYLYRGDSLDIYTIRPTYVFGPGRDRGWSGRFIDDAVHDGEGHIPLPPDSRLNFGYVDDTASIFADLVTADAPAYDTYNAPGAVVTVGELADIVAEESGGTVTVDESADPFTNVVDVSYDRANEEFGFEPTPIREAVVRYIDAIS